MLFNLRIRIIVYIFKLNKMKQINPPNGLNFSFPMRFSSDQREFGPLTKVYEANDLSELAGVGETTMLLQSMNNLSRAAR